MGLFSRGLSRHVKWEFLPKGRIFTTPAVADVNGDGVPEVIIGSDDHRLYALRGSDGGVAWSFETDGPVRSSPTITDINNDGVLEVIFGSDDSNIYCLNGVDGRVLWALKCGGPIRSPPAVGDMECDGRLEVVASGDDATIYAIDGSSGELFWQSGHRSKRSDSPVQSAPCLVDLEGDGQLEVVTGSASSYVLIFGSEGSLRTRREFEAPSFNASVAAGDLEGDGKPGIVACSDNGAVYALTPEGETLWSKVIGVGARSSPVLSDINGDGRLEVLVNVSRDAGDEGRLVCLSSRGEVLWDRYIRGIGASNPVPVDIDFDGGIEIIAFSEKDGIHILGQDGEEIKHFGAPGDGGAGIAVADVDSNGEFELVYASFGGQVVCLETQYSCRHGQILASGARSDIHNSGVYRTTLQTLAALKEDAKRLKEAGGMPGVAYQNLLKAEREQGGRDITVDLERVQRSFADARSKLTRSKRQQELLSTLKAKMKVFSSLDVDGASKLSLTVSRIERMLAAGKDPGTEFKAAEEMAEILQEKSKEKLQEMNAKRLSFLVGQFLEEFTEPSDADIEGFIKYLESEKLPFLPYEIKKAIEGRKHERKFQSLRDSGRFDFMSEEEKVIAIGSSLSESIIHDIMDTMGVPITRIQKRMDDISTDYPNVPRLVISESGKMLTDELRNILKEIPEHRVIATAISLFCVYITKLFDYYQELTDFETSYSRFKQNMDYLNASFGAEEIVQQFQERACHGIFAEEVRVKRILDL